MDQKSEREAAHKNAQAVVKKVKQVIIREHEASQTHALAELVTVANKHFDGHFTIMKFSSNWRVGFGTPNSRCDIDMMWEGNTLAEAASAALAGYRITQSRCQTHEFLRGEDITGECPFCGDILTAV
jgi:hypothetical protein